MECPCVCAARACLQASCRFLPLVATNKRLRASMEGSMEILVGVLQLCRSMRQEGGLSSDNVDDLAFMVNKKRIRARFAVCTRQSKSVANCCLLRVCTTVLRHTYGTCRGLAFCSPTCMYYMHEALGTCSYAYRSW